MVQIPALANDSAITSLRVVSFAMACINHWAWRGLITDVRRQTYYNEYVLYMLVISTMDDE